MCNDEDMRISYLMKNIEKGCGILYNIVKRNYIKGITYMKPRIFISSTFYDLKYIREDLANFVRSYGYEPILFEDGDIGYTPGETLDSSCYESMRNSDMVILIIGGEYGSAASGEKKDGFKEYMSVTRNEFRTAVESGIPILVMIDKKVMTEYGVYEANYDGIEKENRMMAFPTTKNINVFRFIKEIKGIVTLPIQEFERSSDIKGFISKQWADMFKNYLSALRNERENRKIENSVDEMKTLVQKMDIMLDSIGKIVLSKDNPSEYQNVINLQEIVSFCNTLIKGYSFAASKSCYSYEERKEISRDILDIINNIYLDDQKIKIKNDRLVQEFEDKYGEITLELPYMTDIIKKKSKVLTEKNTVNEIINIISEEEYFNRFLK